MAETDTGVAQGGLGKVIGDAVIAFNHTNVMLPLVTAKQSVKGAIIPGEATEDDESLSSKIKAIK